MGMSASQARLLGLQARQSNLEYQGQQINQERTILSQQCTALYNSLLAMQVPTPPSTQDFTTIEYSGSDGATNFSIGAVKPSGENYCVEFKTTETGKALQSDYGTRVVAVSDAKIKVSEVESNTLTLEPQELSNYYVEISGEDSEEKNIVQLNPSNAQEYGFTKEDGNYVYSPSEEYILYKKDI